MILRHYYYTKCCILQHDPDLASLRIFLMYMQPQTAAAVPRARGGDLYPERWCEKLGFTILVLLFGDTARRLD